MEHYQSDYRMENKNGDHSTVSAENTERVSRYSDGSISVEIYGKTNLNDQFSLYSKSGIKTFHSYNTNDQTRIDEFFDDDGKLAQTKVFHVDSERRMNQEIVFKGTEKVLESIEDLYWDGRKDVFKADEQGRLKLQKQ